MSRGSSGRDGANVALHPGRPPPTSLPTQAYAPVPFTSALPTTRASSIPLLSCCLAWAEEVSYCSLYAKFWLALGISCHGSFLQHNQGLLGSLSGPLSQTMRRCLPLPGSSLGTSPSPQSPANAGLGGEVKEC